VRPQFIGFYKALVLNLQELHWQSPVKSYWYHILSFIPGGKI